MLGTELLVNTPLIQDYIRDENKTAFVKDAMLEANIRGMHTFDQHLAELYRHPIITLDEAMESASSPHELRMMITRQGMNF